MAEGHVVGRYIIGHTKIVICDDYCVKTEEEKKKILDNISKIFAPHYDPETFVDKPLEFSEKMYVADENWQPIKEVDLLEQAEKKNKK